MQATLSYPSQLAQPEEHSHIEQFRPAFLSSEETQVQARFSPEFFSSQNAQQQELKKQLQ